ncbi:zinc finger protein 62 homolog [Sitodiplosis mosellana]|uniref:zinc finger protein 62 homolog n=1 Tax=Sitodiplosis mosellana TaxID=263140 RepID=UPI0024444F8A|nr:zinc finger protein 62 homolog [Sitodiplosis mosellana]
MSGTKTVHQCLFCPQTFGSAVEKDDHILEHFAQETCADCDQSLIRIGSNLYTLHNAVTCIKRESKPDVSIQHDSQKGLINQNHDEGDYNATAAICDRQMNIKLEPHIEQTEQPVCVDPINFVETRCDGNYTESINKDRDEDNAGINVTPSNTVSVGEIEIKMEPETPVEEFICVDGNNFTAESGMDFDTSKGFYNQPISTASEKSSKGKRKNNYKHKCDVCEKLFEGPAKLKVHKKFRHSSGVEFHQFDCDICKKSFLRESYLRKHMRLIHDDSIEKFRCESCWQVFFSKKSLDKHHLLRCKRIKKGLKAKPVIDIARIETPKTDIDTTAKIVKWNMKTKENDKYCEICCKTFFNKNTADRHKIQVHKMGGHHCNDCKKVFHSAAGLLNHGPNCDKLAKTFECCFCHSKNKYQKNLRSHIRFVHVQKEKKYKCDICGKGFHLMAQCEDHKNRMHLNVRKWMCSTCGLAFKTKQGFMQHEPCVTQETFNHNDNNARDVIASVNGFSN